MSSQTNSELGRLLAVSQRLAMLPVAWWELYWAASETIGYRLGAMALAGTRPNARQQRENQRMVREKGDAALETAQALFAPSFTLPLELGNLWLQAAGQGVDKSTRYLQQSPTAPATWGLALPLLMAEQALDTWEQGSRPWHSRATANARRLRRRRR